MSFKSSLSSLLGRTPLALFPVRVRAGMARGAWWTLLPHSSYWRGYEPEVDVAVRELGLPKGASCWDLGTHFGIYTVGLAMAVGPTGEVAAFEPDPRSHARCARHVRMNRLDWVRLFNAGAGETTARQSLIITGGLGSSDNHLRYESEATAPGERTIAIEIFALDDLVAAGRIRPPVFVKVDVEGHGAKALRGARETLARHRPTLVMSFHSQAETDDSQALLEPMGYRCYDLTARELPWADAIYHTVILKPVKAS